MKGYMSTKQPIYSLSPQKLDALWEYLEENLWKEFIWESQSSARYSILFVLKSDSLLRLCVNYWALNNITVKNSYSLLLISELQDQFQKVHVRIMQSKSCRYDDKDINCKEP